MIHPSIEKMFADGAMKAITEKVLCAMQGKTRHVPNRTKKMKLVTTDRLNIVSAENAFDIRGPQIPFVAQGKLMSNGPRV